MKLWIRSQSKVLFEEATMIKVGTYDEGKTHSIIVNNDYVYADYKTKERALEVLDEIQKLLDTFEPKNMAKMIVYEMPQE